mgnify:CR=1 FL=1
MRIFEDWAHSLFPKYSLMDFSLRVESECQKKIMKVYRYHSSKDYNFKEKL